MNNSRIEVNEETGRRSLTVFYDDQTNDFDRQIEEAMVYHGVSDGEMTVLAMPKSMKNNGDCGC